MVLIGEMLIMLIMLNPYSRKNIPGKGDVNNVVFMLNQNGDSLVDPEMGFNTISIINISLARNKKCFWQGKC